MNTRNHGKGFGLLFEMGCGKSLTAIAIMGALYEMGKIRRVLVISPGSVVSVWEEELARFAAFPYIFAPLLGTKRQRLKKLALLEMGVPAQACHGTELLAPEGGSPTRYPWGAMTGDGDACTAAPAGGVPLLIAGINYESTFRDGIFEALWQYAPDLMICDESQRIKNPKAQQSLAVQKLAEKAAYRLALTGTPIQQDAQDVFSQYKFLDKTIFGDNFYSYRARYCKLGGFGGKQVVGTKNEAELSTRMYSIAYRVTKAECLDLPPETFITRTVELNPQERKIYDEIRKNAVAELSEEKQVSATTVLTKLLRLQQAAGGFLKADDDERVTQIGTSKLDALRDIVEDYVLGEGRKLVVFAKFLPEIAGICDLLRERGIHYGRITGAVSLAERGEIVQDFQMNPETMAFVAQLQTAGLGITLHAASAAVFYSVGYNLADYQQALARIHRKGQTHPCTYLLLQAARTVDQQIMEALEKKSDIAKRICDDWQTYFE